MVNFRKSFLRILALCFVASGVLSSRGAHAQEGISIETFKISSSSDSLFETVLPSPKKHLDWTVGLLLSHAQEPVYRTVKRQDAPKETGYPVWFRRQLDISAALGLFDIAELGIVFPVVLYQKSEDSISGRGVQKGGTGDPRIDFKVQILHRPYLTLGAGASVTFPLGHYVSSGRDFMGSKLPAAEPKVLIEAPAGPLILSANVGFLFRDKVSLGSQTQTHAFTWNTGVAWDVDDFKKPNGFRVLLEANGEMDIDVDRKSTPVEMLLGFKYRGYRDTVFSIGAGPGISRGLGTPSFRAFVGISYDPITRLPKCETGPEDKDGFEDDDRCRDPDNDEDGFLDEDDKCPDDAEDMDAFEDGDGCPDLDNDQDTIPDAVDACPMIPEDRDQFEDEDGCPEEGPGKAVVKITETQLLLSSKIYFDYDKTAVKQVSFPILDAVAEAVLANPYIKKIRIEGHTDNEGTEEYNRVLSEKRAKAVMQYLIKKNVPEERLSYKGFGSSRPKASNTSEVGKAINRRVEFTIVTGESHEE
jgi:outer membrane protein OmpA-like peptidoglycan-associated protein